MENPKEEQKQDDELRKIYPANIEGSTEFFDGCSKEETIEEAAERLVPKTIISEQDKAIWRVAFEECAKWQAERMYSEEEVHQIIESYQNIMENNPVHTSYNKWFEQFKKR